MKCVYIRIGEFLAQLALSTPLYEKHAADIFEEFPDTDKSIRAAATIAVKFAFALATNDKEKSEAIKDIDMIIATAILSRARDTRWPNGELILKPEVLPGPTLGKGIMFEAGPNVGTPTIITRWGLGAGANVERTVNFPTPGSPSRLN